jgi:hypothetical protein
MVSLAHREILDSSLKESMMSYFHILTFHHSWFPSNLMPCKSLWLINNLTASQHYCVLSSSTTVGWVALIKICCDRNVYSVFPKDCQLPPQCISFISSVSEGFNVKSSDSCIDCKGFFPCYMQFLLPLFPKYFQLCSWVLLFFFLFVRLFWLPCCHTLFCHLLPIHSFICSWWDTMKPEFPFSSV